MLGDGGEVGKEAEFVLASSFGRVEGVQLMLIAEYGRVGSGLCTVNVGLYSVRTMYKA